MNRIVAGVLVASLVLAGLAFMVLRDATLIESPPPTVGRLELVCIIETGEPIVLQSAFVDLYRGAAMDQALSLDLCAEGITIRLVVGE